MNPAIAAFALAGMLPAMTDGALPHSNDGIVLALCSGGSIAVHSNSPAGPRPANAPCCAKGCRDNDRRRKAGSGEFDPAQ
jgi:hypothetical protein